MKAEISDSIHYRAGKMRIYMYHRGQGMSFWFDTLVYNKHYQNFECHRDKDGAIIAIIPTKWLTVE